MDFIVEQNKERYSLKTAFNARDLSGYVGDGGRITGGKYIRSDCFMPLCAEDAAFLQDIGVCMAIDLRSLSESEKIPCGLVGRQGIEYASLPLMSNDGKVDMSMMPENFNMGMLYIEILERKKSELCTFFRLIQKAGSGKVLFHCSAGKDRTGVVSALLLKTAGVGDTAVINDYALTEVFLKEMMPALKEHSGIPAMLNLYVDELLGSRPVNMQSMLEYIDKKYGGIYNYLSEIGLEAHEIALIRESMFD